MKLVVGLGNPGGEYRHTRHNLGFMILDRLVEKLGGRFGKSKFLSDTAGIVWNGEKLLLLKPLTYMNKSGDSVAGASAYFKIESEDILVVHDDLDLDFGRMKIRTGGSDGGHKGIRSISRSLSTNSFPRIRMGIGKPAFGESPADYVLREFYAREKALVDDWIEAGMKAVLHTLKDGAASAANAFNGKLWVELSASEDG